MNFKGIILSLVLLIGISTNLSANVLEQAGSDIAVMQSDHIIHQVERGETVYSIAAAYRTTVDEIHRLNPSSVNGIREGEGILVPRTQAGQVPMHVPTPASYIEHEVKAKETLYNLATKYNLKVDDIKRANEGLDESTLKAGEKIRIPLSSETRILPQSAPAVRPTSTPTPAQPTFVTPVLQDKPARQVAALREYTLQKRDTLYGLSKAWNVSVDDIVELNPSIKIDGLREGSVIYMPIHAQSASTVGIKYQKIDEIKVAILLPFLQSGETIEKEKIVEYYEGILIAVRELKSKGLNAMISSFDIGSHTSTDRLEGILYTQEVKEANLIIGGISPQQISAISQFSKENGIKYVVPFGAVDGELKNNPNLFQAISSHSALYDAVAAKFKKVYDPEEYNFIFVSKPGSSKTSKSDFIALLKKSLSSSKIQYKNTTLNADFQANLKDLLVLDKKNLIIPTSSSETTIRQMMPTLNAHEGEETIALFGYPEWQIFTSFNNSFHKYDTYIYSIFYFDSRQNSVLRFDEEYKKWFGKELVKSYPKYAHLGYDMASYFLTALNNYGTIFESRIDDISVPTLQSAMRFQKVGNGGYVNNGLYFIHYKTDSTKEKFDCNNKE